MIFRTPKVTPVDEAVIDSIRGHWTQLRARLDQQPRKWTGLLRRDAQARAIQGSNSIEGYFVSGDDALAAVDQEVPFEAEASSMAAVKAYQDAMTFALETATDDDFVIDVGLLRGLHAIMLRNAPDKRPGRWRRGAIGVTQAGTGERVYEAPDREDVPELVSALVDQLNEPPEGESLLLTAAMAHLNLAMIHPFADGNGRMSRCLQTLVLADGGVVDPIFCSVEEYLGANTQDYYDVLQKVGQGSWNPGNDASPWVRFTLKAHYQQATIALRRQQEMASLCAALEELLGSMGLPERATFALHDAAKGHRIRNGEYQMHADVTAQMATKDLARLVKAGLLQPRGQKRGRHYVASGSLSEIGNRHCDRSPVEDPYSALT
jgi:Fic family protein